MYANWLDGLLWEQEAGGSSPLTWTTIKNNDWNDIMKKNFKECKKIFEDYSNGKMTKEVFESWSKENCDNCFFYKITGRKRCLFGSK